MPVVVVVVVNDRERIRMVQVVGRRKQNEVIVRLEGIPVPIAMSMLLLLWQQFPRIYGHTINHQEKKRKMF